MNVDAQFQQPFTTETYTQRPLDKPVEQTTTRPVDNPKAAEAAANKPGQDADQARNKALNSRSERSVSTPRPDTQISQEQQAVVEKLRSRDREVRAHEAAHKAVAGQFVRGSAQFSYEKGPDGKRYAVGGEVSIDASKVSGNPQATIAKAQAIRSAANAPAQPSGQDRSVAIQATQMEAEARRELAETGNSTSEKSTTAPGTQANRIQTTNNPPATVGDLLDVVA